MSLGQALSTALSGLRVGNAGMALVASNIANADTPGYVRKTQVQVATANGDLGVGVRTASVGRALDAYVQRQLRVETSGGTYASTRAELYQRLNALFGTPGGPGAMDTVYNAFTGALQALATTPESYSARVQVLSAGQALTQHLNGMTADVQALRADAEQRLGELVPQVNEALRHIATLNGKLAVAGEQDSTVALMKDQRDTYVDQLSRLMDVRVVGGEGNQISVFTGTGVQLVGAQAAELKFNANYTITPATQWNADPQKCTVGTISLVSASGSSIDLIASGAFRSGEIAALVEMRDTVLVEAQGQLDELASRMALALSNRQIASAPASAGAQTGFAIDTAGLLAGNSISLTYTDVTAGLQRRVTIVRVDDPAALPLAPSATADANDQVVGVNFSAGMGSVVAQLNTALGPGLQWSNPAGTTLRVLDDGAGNTRNVDALSAEATASGLLGQLELPLFTDGSALFTRKFTGAGAQTTGFAGRISVNPAVLSDPSRLVSYQSTTPSGDGSRPDFLLRQLTTSSFTFASGGAGPTGTAFGGSLPDFIQHVISIQGEAAASAQSLSEGQDVVVQSLRQRMNSASGVNIDEEMTSLINLQTAYGANARVLSAVRDMMDLLLKI